MEQGRLVQETRDYVRTASAETHTPDIHARRSSARTFLALAFAMSMLNGCGGGGGCDQCGGPATHAIGATINGLVGSRLVLSNNGNTVSIAPAFNGQMPKLFANLANGASYDITVTTQPTTPSQTCVVANGRGTIANADVTDISVTCTTTPARFLLGQGPGLCVEASTIDSTTGALASTAAAPLCSIPVQVPIVPNGEMAVEPQGKFLYIANPNGQIGFLDTLAVDHNSGAVTYVQSESQVEIRDVAVDPSGKFLFVSNGGPGGLSGGIGTAIIDSASGALTFPPSGRYQFPNGQPAAIAVDPLGRFVYVAFYSDQARVVALPFNSTTGALSQGASPVAVDASRWIVAHPSGKFLYVLSSNSIVAFNVDPTNGTLTPIAGSPSPAGSDPGSAAVDPSGTYLYVANELSNDISAYTIDHSSGQLTPVAGSPFQTRQAPTAITIEPLGHFLYVSSDDANTAKAGVSAYKIGSAGVLTEISGSPFTTAFGTHAVISY
jgi:6-phosphogluconolactonase